MTSPDSVEASQFQMIIIAGKGHTNVGGKQLWREATDLSLKYTCLYDNKSWNKNLILLRFNCNISLVMQWEVARLLKSTLVVIKYMTLYRIHYVSLPTLQVIWKWALQCAVEYRMAGQAGRYKYPSLHQVIHQNHIPSNRNFQILLCFKTLLKNKNF